MMKDTQDAKETDFRFDERILNDFAASLTLSNHSAELYKKCLAYFFSYLSEKGIDRPESGDIAAYAGELSKSGRKAKTVYTYIAAVRAFFRWTQSMGLYRDISESIPVTRTERTPNRKSLTAVQLRKVLNSMDRESVQGMRDYAILALMLTGGLSALELSRANVSDVGESAEGCFFYVRGDDGRRKDDVKVPRHVAEALSEYLNARRQVNEEQDISPDAPLFVSVSCRNRDKNEHMSAGSVSRIAKNALRNAGYDDALLSARSLRVSAIKLALRNGERLEDVQKFARHKQIRTTFLYRT